jgi:hypothetical protein
MQRPASNIENRVGLPAKPIKDGLRLFIRLTPRSQAEGIKGLSTGPDGARLELKVRAAPERGAANAAAERLIAELLGVPRQAVCLASGAASRYKVFDIAGDHERLADRLRARLQAQVKA